MNFRIRVPHRAAVSLVLIGLCCAPVGFGLTAGGPGRSLRVIYTANLRGVLEPCGCQALQPGGLSRRATLLRALRSGDTATLLVDVGDNLPPSSARPETLQFVYGVLQTLKYDVVNVGPFDLALSGSQIQEAAEKAGLALVAGAAAAGAEPPGPPVRVVAVGNMRVAVIGATAAREETDGAVVIRQIRETARRVRASSDLIIVLSQMSPGDVHRCAEGAPEVDFFISGRHDADLTTKLRVGRSHILPCSFYGQSIGVAEISLDARKHLQSVVATLHRVDPGLPRDPAVQALVDKFYEEHFRVSPGEGKGPLQNRSLADLFAGEEGQKAACQNCHRDVYDSWRSTRHARAWQALVEKGAADRSDCISCHTTNQMTLSSFSPEMTGVGCATCHGGDPDHARFPHDPRFVVRRPAEAVCRNCHTPLQSPRFRYGPFLPRVAHGASMGSEPAGAGVSRSRRTDPAIRQEAAPGGR